MSIRDVIERALRVYYADSAEPNAIARDLLAQYDAERDDAREQSSRPTVAGSRDCAYPAERIERYITALREADTYAQLERRDDRERFARAVMAVADAETDPVYRSGYGTGREHAGAAGWLLQDFEAVISTSDGSHGVAGEYRCRTCGAIGAQGTGPRSLLDLVAMAARHECLPNLDRKDAS
ncbi:hypothetical protein JK361_22735 [Streptomyces sp. 5-8]|uniref:DUF2786 domain-containing protein n=1 Tax=Streptomyces musisoli TaxID=2802280 RepID=A0ABS1P4U4_9ACTN|nr:hypothetical protein [Streptomyces musisoli]MBL1107387.1 hypothetical protein [Streptomyces musisoli]